MVGGDATIWGTVNNSVIVVNGNVVLKASAKINSFVLVIGGGLVVGTWLLQLAVSIVFVILPVMTVFFSKHRINPFVDRARQTPGYFLYIGFFSSLIFIAMTFLY
ncbi:hypothetical protein PaeBR_14255 [Paenibacillus sp. BR2-3]|uniref:hypothetical protein n=1 Tax=Paenibacillus sp. BR2-3 TaxID=3048494 RepID=UPI003977E2A1